jgi:hypothetical protein
MLPDNLVQGRIDQDPSVPGRQLGGRQDVGVLDDVRLGQLDRLLDQTPTRGLPPGIPLGRRRLVEFSRMALHPRHQLPEDQIVIEAMQWELQLAR